MADFVPKSLMNMKTWLEGLKGGIDSDGASCGRSAAQITADKALVDTMLTPVTAAVTAETAWLDARGTAETAISTGLPAARDLLNLYKKSPGWTKGMADSWKVSTQAKTYDYSTQAPRITAQASPGMVIVRGAKPGFTSVTIQMRVDGSSSWTDIGIKLSRFPFLDTTAPQTAGKPEKREYRALGYVNDQQLGQPSEIVTGIYGV